MYTPYAKSRTAFYEREHQKITRQFKFENLASDGTATATLKGGTAVMGQVTVINYGGTAVGAVTLDIDGTEFVTPAFTATGDKVHVQFVATPAYDAEPRVVTVSAASFPADSGVGVVFEYVEIPHERNIT